MVGINQEHIAVRTDKIVTNNNIAPRIDKVVLIKCGLLSHSNNRVPV